MVFKMSRIDEIRRLTCILGVIFAIISLMGHDVPWCKVTENEYIHEWFWVPTDNLTALTVACNEMSQTTSIPTTSKRKRRHQRSLLDKVINDGSDSKETPEELRKTFYCFFRSPPFSQFAL